MDNSQQTSQIIKWGGRLGLLCLFLVPASVLAVRLGLHYSIGLRVFALSCLLAMVVIIVLVVVSLLPAYSAQRTRAWRAALPALPPVILILGVLGTAGDYPAIHDITTDTEDPPVFHAAPQLRGADSNPLDIKNDVIKIQLESYPDLGTLHTELDADAAFARAEQLAESLHWEIYSKDPDQGLIEASYTSFWFGFVDDIAIRVRPTDNGSEIDLRSVSRVGIGDLGANAGRISVFMERFQE